MKKHLIFAATVLLMTGLAITSCCNQKADTTALRAEFAEPPSDVRIGVYWYWMKDNISKDGVVRDLQAMKLAGITRAFIGNIGDQTHFPEGKVKIFTDEWWDILHTALKTAADLDIEIGIFNCPGWSQSGGPWIAPEQAMRYLASVERRVVGPTSFSEKLIPAEKDFQDVRTLAFPAHRHSLAFKRQTVETVERTPQTREAGRGNNDRRGPRRPARQDVVYSFVADAPQSAQAMIYRPTEPINCRAEIQYREGEEMKTLKQFSVNRSNPALNVGFDPYAPIVISFPATTSTEFRLVLRGVTKVPEYTELAFTHEPIIERYPEKSLAKMFQTPLPLWPDYMWEQQTADTSEATEPTAVIDITDRLAADGTVTWDVPEGEWIIMRTGMSPTGVTNGPATPEGTGLEVDKMNREHAKYHFDKFLGEILRRIPAADRRSFKIIVEDSYETGGQNFTDGMIDEFTARYGYDPTPYLPTLKGYAIGSPDMADRFLWDLRRLIADKVAYDYVAGLRDAGNADGLTTWLENYGHWGFPAEFLQYGGQSDEIGGEFWDSGELGSIECRAASSCAHIYNKKTVSAESFTSGANYGRQPAALKKRGDWSFSEGINKTLLHVYIQQPYEDVWPGVDAWF
jgi:hypothetical protein